MKAMVEARQILAEAIQSSEKPKLQLIQNRRYTTPARVVVIIVINSDYAHPGDEVEAQGQSDKKNQYTTDEGRPCFPLAVKEVVVYPVAQSYQQKWDARAVIQSDWDEIKEITIEQYKELLLKRPLIIDGRRTFQQSTRIKNGVEYYGIGWKNKTCAIEEIILTRN